MYEKLLESSYLASPNLEAGNMQLVTISMSDAFAAELADFPACLRPA